jgi:hypothetical protein
MNKNSAVFRVTETISNQNTLAKIFNIVQHSTIGAPFLDETTIVNTKVMKGFSQDGTVPPAESDTLDWPFAMLGADTVDLRYLNGTGPEQSVLTYILDKDQEYGWITASKPSGNLLIGYLWLVDEYPWLNLWLQQWGGIPGARGFEFGTTGLHQPFSMIEEIDTIFGQKLYEMIETDETVSKSYIAYEAKIPSDYKGVSDVQYANDQIKIIENGMDSSRTILLDIGTVTDIISNGNVSPEQFHLSQNYPNPFNPATIISYQLSDLSNVKLTVYDLLGRKIETIINKQQSAGKYQVKFNASGLSSGIYFYRLQAGQFSQTKKMILNR